MELEKNTLIGNMDEFKSVFADLAVVNSYNKNSIQFSTIMFMRNTSSPVFNENSELQGSGELSIRVHSQHIGSVTMTDIQMKNLYLMLKKAYEKE